MKKTFNTALLSAGIFAAAGIAQAAVTDAAKHRVDRAEIARVEKPSLQTPTRPAAVIPAATVTYSGTTVGSPTFARAIADCTALDGDEVNYSVQPFTVDTAGAYDLTSEQDYDAFIFLYTGAFDPSNALTNCTAGNDDGAAGIGTSEIFAASLASGTSYFLVTASYAQGESGSFTNTITGPGNISLPAIALAKTSPGVALSGDFTYVLDVQNTGPSNETVTVTDPLPAGLTYVSNTCGGTFAAGTFTWNVGVVNASASATCTITVNNPTDMCTGFTNTATATTVSGLSVSSTVSNTEESVADPSLEVSGANGGGDWASTSTNFSTVFCLNALFGGCTSNPSLIAADGTWWAWFGGIDPADPGTATLPEVGTLEQSVTIPSGANQLTFQLQLPNCSGQAADFLSLRIDGTEVFRIDATDASCGGAYAEKTVDISAYADGNSHTITFHSEQSGTGTDAANFFVDVVSIKLATCLESDAIFADGFEAVP